MDTFFLKTGRRLLFYLRMPLVNYGILFIFVYNDNNVSS